MIVNLEGIVLLSASEMIWELCEFLISIIQRINWYKVPVVGRHGKLNETIEVSALWSKRTAAKYTVVKNTLYARSVDLHVVCMEAGTALLSYSEIDNSIFF